MEDDDSKYAILDFDEAIENFGEEIGIMAMDKFVDETYPSIKKDFPKFYKSQQYEEIKKVVHKLKTSTSYFGAYNFAELCNKMQVCYSPDTLNEEEIDLYYPKFMTSASKLKSEILKLKATRYGNKEKKEEEKKEEKKEEEKKEEKKEEEKKEEEKKNEVKKEEEKKDEILKEEEKKEENKKNEKKEKLKSDNKLSGNNTMSLEKNKPKFSSNSTGNQFNLKPISNTSSKSADKSSSDLIDSTSNQNQSEDNLKSNNLYGNNQNNYPKHIKSSKLIPSSRVTFSTNNLLNVENKKLPASTKDYKFEQMVNSLKITKEDLPKEHNHKIGMSPGHKIATEKNKVLNLIKLGFSNINQEKIKEYLMAYDEAVLKYNASLVNKSIQNFLKNFYPKIFDDLKEYIKECDLSKKNQLLSDLINIKNNMKYFENKDINDFLFLTKREIESCKDVKIYKNILKAIYEKFKLLNEELTIIDNTKISKNAPYIVKVYLTNNLRTKGTSKTIYGENSLYKKSNQNNNEQIEDLKKDLNPKNTREITTNNINDINKNVNENLIEEDFVNNVNNNIVSVSKENNINEEKSREVAVEQSEINSKKEEVVDSSNNDANKEMKDSHKNLLSKADANLLNELKRFNVSAFFQPKGRKMTQKYFEHQISKVIKETNKLRSPNHGNKKLSNECNIKPFQHIKLSNSFRARKNKYIGFSYPFKEDNILNNCSIF